MIRFYQNTETIRTAEIQRRAESLEEYGKAAGSSDDNIFIIPHSFKQFQAIYLFLSGISGKVGEHPVVSENFNRRPPSCPEERAGRKIPGIIYPWNFLIGFSRTVHHQV
ncbi:hypothetical protein CH238_11170 [[Clostridium] leptum DSM 753]|uniref:Uncharacterized protein n=1 Tax=[Clostridium] leptum DSM 753 TaxID=428125 RepID=A0A855A2A2_9FIRM|nr:hypothetical protein CH238_11170 [[Clostridium] leptum DSM 753]